MTEEVIQADREAAADSSPHNERWGMLVRAGALDGDPLVQAFARHRLAHLPTDLSEDRAREVLRSVAGPSEGLCNVSDALRAMHQYAAGLQGAVEALRLAMHEIDVEAANTIPPDGKEAAFAALDRITAIINPFRLPRTALGDTQS